MLANGVKETTTTTGTGTVTLASVAGRVRFSQGFPIVGQLVNYSIKSGDNLEWGIGTVGAGNTLARTVVLGTLVAGTLTTVGAVAITLAGTSDVLCTDYDQARLSAIPAAQTGYIISGHFCGFPGAGVATGADADIQYFHPFRMDYAKSINSLSVDVTLAVASAKFRLGIYSVKTDGDPGFLIAETADLDPGTTGVKTASITQTRLPPGWYFTSILSSLNTGVRGLQYGVGSSTPLGIALSQMTAAPIVRATIASGWTGLGDPAPAVTRATTNPQIIAVGVAA